MTTTMTTAATTSKPTVRPTAIYIPDMLLDDSIGVVASFAVVVIVLFCAVDDVVVVGAWNCTLVTVTSRGNRKA